MPSFNDLVVKACAIALSEHPKANGAYRDARFEHYSRVNVGVAVAADGTLVVPTVFDADRKGLAQIASETRALAERVRSGQITPPELSGGTFTVSNLGMFGVRSFEAVINPPQAAILAVGALEQRPVVRDGCSRDRRPDGRRARLRPPHPLRRRGRRVPRAHPPDPRSAARARALMPRSGDRLTSRERAERRAAQALARLSPRAQVRLSRRPAVRLDGQTLSPEIQMTLALLERRGDPPIETLTPVEARAQTRRTALVVAGRPVPVGAVRDLSIDGAEGPLRARLYSCDEPGGPHPLLVYFHGGGFVIGDLDSHDGVCRMLCVHAGVNVLAVEYRLAPEHPFPAAVDDGRASLRWAIDNAAALGADPARVAVGGDSAGGNISAVASQTAARDGGPGPALQLLVYPATDASTPRPSAGLFAEGFFLTRAQMDWFIGHYAADSDLTDPRMSPLLAGDLSGLAPALVVTAGFDPLRDEGEAYAAALRAAGTPVLLRRFPGLIHGFVNAAGISRVSRDALIEVAGATRAMLAVLPAGAAQAGPGAALTARSRCAGPAARRPAPGCSRRTARRARRRPRRRPRSRRCR